MSLPRLLGAFATIVAFSSSIRAGDVRTVPWNGHPGAVSFTFDDNLDSQIDHVLPAARKLGIKVTFFVTASFDTRSDVWKAAALDGHELGNHTTSHDDPGGLDSARLEAQFTKQAIKLRALDAAVEAVTLAYPYCNTKDLAVRIADRENIIARTCGGTDPFAWGTKPSDWMRMTSFVISNDDQAKAALDAIDRAASGNGWLVTLNHGIETGYGPITKVQLDTMFQRAVARKTWIAPYQTVAAYWRASFVMDTVRAKKDGDGWSLAWMSPHPKMPRRVPLRIRLDSNVFGKTPKVVQGGSEVLREPDGSYVVDFMKLSMSISKSLASGVRASKSAARPKASRSGNRIRLQGVPTGSYRWSLEDVRGRSLGRGLLDADPSRGRSFIDAVPGVLAVRLEPVTVGTPFRMIVLDPS